MVTGKEAIIINSRNVTSSSLSERLRPCRAGGWLHAPAPSPMHTLTFSHTERFIREIITQKVNDISTSYSLHSSLSTPARQLLRSSQRGPLLFQLPPPRSARVSWELLFLERSLRPAACFRGAAFNKLATVPSATAAGRPASGLGGSAQYRGGRKGLFGANMGPGFPLPIGPGRLPRSLGSGPRKGGNGGRSGPLGKWWGGG